MKIISNLFFVIFLITTQIPQPENIYYFPTGQLFCNSKKGCYHEEGHWLDSQLKFPSTTKDFQDAIDLYIKECDFNDASCKLLNDFPGITKPRKDIAVCRDIRTACYWKGGWGGYMEAYAELYEKTQGNIDKIPLPLQSFYKDTVAYTSIKEKGIQLLATLGLLY